MTRPVPEDLDHGAVVGRVAVRLARQGTAGLSEALALLVADAPLASAVLRRPDGALLAVAGDTVRAVPVRRGGRRPGQVAELAVAGPSGLDLAHLTVTGMRPAQLPTVRGCAAVIGLALAAELPEAFAQDRWSERDHLADALHDGPVQDLVAARYAADLAVRGGDAGPARDAVQRALVALRRTVWQLRPRGADGLVQALQVLSERLVEAGGAPLGLDLDRSADRLAPGAATAAYAVVQSAAARPGTLAVRLSAVSGDERRVRLSITGDLPADLPDVARWSRTATAVGGGLRVLDGRVELILPVRPEAVPSVRAPVPTLKAVP